MKRIISLLIVLLTISSCYYSMEPVIDGLQYESIHDEFSLGDTTFFYTNCNVNRDKAEFYFVRRDVILQKVDTVLVLDKIYLINRDTTIVTQESYLYSPEEFESMLLEKNSQPRTDYWFLFTPKMGVRWSAFDKIFNKYITK